MVFQEDDLGLSEIWKLGIYPPPDSLAMDQWRSAEKLVNQ